MGLAMLILVLKTVAMRAVDDQRREHYNSAARFWTKIFAINFAMGVVTGIPMDFSSALIGCSFHAPPEE